MELVYLWVENYKNIQKQGFNFSPKFNCHYDGKILTIKDNVDANGNKEYIENFFGTNINVTAIVGKNGSGKSSVFELLSQILIKKNKLKYFYILFDGVSCNVYINDMKVITPLSKKSYTPRKEINGTLVPENSVGNIELKNNMEIYYLNISHLERDNLIQNDAIPFEDPLNYLGIYAKNDFDKSIDNSIFPSFSEFNLDKFNYFLVYSIGHLLMDKKYSNFFFDVFKIKQPNKLKISFNKEELLKIKTSNTKTRPDDTRMIDENVPPKIDKILSFLKKNSVVDIGSEKYNKFFELSSSFYDSQSHFKLTFGTDKNEMIKFSSGEFTVFYYLNKIDDMLHSIRTKKQENIILLWDEIELYLHPMWQKKILKIVLDFIKIVEPECLLHIIISSHSPFLLSDIPKQNIIFLDKDADGKCIVVDGLKEKKQTFGANIHTLLSDSFFMDGGLMGEFAKNKIRTIKVAHQYILHKHKRKTLVTKSCKRCRRLLIKRLSKFWQIQKIIGEPFLQKIVQNQLEEIEFILLGRNEAIDKEIARLEALKESSNA